MLKKAGIAVATTAAALLAVSPLAFAGQSGGHGVGHGVGNKDHHAQKGLVNVQDNVIQANVCDNNINVLGIQVPDIAGALSLLSEGDTTAEENDECENKSSN